MLLSELKSHDFTTQKHMEPTTPALKQNAGNKAKHWTFTIFNYDDATLGKFEDIKEFATYWIYGQEICPTTGNKHLQCYIVGKKQITLPTMRKWFGQDAKYLVSRGTPQENQVYCSKEGAHVSWGELPEAKSSAGGAATKAKWVSIANLATQKNLSQIMEEYPKEFVTSYRSLKQIGFDFNKSPEDLKAPCGEWIWGKAGVGKSFTARQENPGAFMKMMNKWWDNYDGQEVVILEDLDPGYIASMSYFLKIWADAYAFPVEIKNHSVMIRPKKFIVTSQYHPKELFTDEKAYEAISRRFKVRNICALDMDDSQVIIHKSNRPTKKLAPMPENLKRKLAQTQKLKKHDKIVLDAKKPRLYKQNKENELVQSRPTIRDLSFPAKASQDISTSTDGSGCIEEIVIPDDENDCERYNDSSELEGSSDFDSFSSDNESNSDSDISD